MLATSKLKNVIQIKFMSSGKSLKSKYNFYTIVIALKIKYITKLYIAIYTLLFVNKQAII